MKDLKTFEVSKIFFFIFHVSQLKTLWVSVLLIWYLKKVIHPIEADCQARNLDKSLANKASNHHIDGTNTATTLVQYQ